MDYYPLVCTLDMILILQYIKVTRGITKPVLTLCKFYIFLILNQKKKTLYCKYLDIELYLFVLI